MSEQPDHISVDDQARAAGRAPGGLGVIQPPDWASDIDQLKAQVDAFIAREPRGSRWGKAGAHFDEAFFWLRENRLHQD